MKSKERKKEKKSANYQISRLKNYLKEELKGFIASFKLDKRFLLSIFYDTCLVLILFIIVQILKKITKKEMALLGLGNISSLSNPALVSQNLSALKSFLLAFIATAIVFLIIMILAYSIFRGMTWRAILRKPASINYFKKFFCLHLIWITAWITVFVLAAISLQKQYLSIAFAAGIIIYLHMTTILHYSFAQKNEIKTALVNSFRAGFGKITKLILPYALIAIAAIIYYLISAKISLTLSHSITALQYNLPYNITTLAYCSAIAIIIYFAWLRIYISNLLNKLVR